MTTLAPRRRPAWYLIAVAEARMLARNKIALLTATVTPLALSGFVLAFSARSEAGASAAVLAGTQLVMLLGFTVYATATMTLTSRREQLYLKRLRYSPAATTEIVGGLTAPLVGLLLAQVTVVLVATGAVTGEAPARPALLVLAALVGCLTCVGLAFFTAAFTRTSEAAQFTTFPGFLALVGGAIWVHMTPADEVTVPMLAVPGAAVAQLNRYGWDAELSAGPDAVAPALIASVVVAALAVYLATRTFRWEPRA